MPDPSSTRGHRFGVLTTFVVLTAIGITVVRLAPELERNLKHWATAVMAALGALLILIWFLFFSRFPVLVRVVGFVLTALMATGLYHSLKKVGTVDGTGWPRLAWRWSPQRTPSLPPATPDNAAAKDAPGARDVPEFFGPQRDGAVRGAGLLPDWKGHPPKELWRIAVGQAWSAFSVMGGRAYTQEQRGEEEAVTCYELTTGRLLWLHAHPGRFEEWQGGPGPRATPVVRDGRVYAMGSTGVLDCLDAATGKEVWSRNLLTEHGMGNLIWGLSGSPLVFDDTVVAAGGEGGPTLVAYKASTGELLWQAGKDSGSYVSPSLVTLLGRQVVLYLGKGELTANDPKTGEQLLAFEWAGGIPAKGSQPVVIGEDRVFLSAGYHAGCIMLRISKSGDGKLAAAKEWESLKMKTQFNSVSLREGHLYGLDDGKLACVNAETGERLWKEGRFGSGQSLLVDDLVIIQSEQGDVVLCSATPQGHKEYGRLAALDSKTWNHPVLAGRYLLVRSDHEAVCYELPVKTP